MDDMDFAGLTDCPHWRVLLEHYQSQAAEGPAPATDDPSAENRGPRWTPRTTELSNVTAEELSASHALLIALGWLQFQLEDSQLGLCYRVSPAGRKALLTTPAETDLIEDLEPQSEFENAA